MPTAIKRAVGAPHVETKFQADSYFFGKEYVLITKHTMAVMPLPMILKKCLKKCRIKIYKHFLNNGSIRPDSQ